MGKWLPWWRSGEVEKKMGLTVERGEDRFPVWKKVVI